MTCCALCITGCIVYLCACNVLVSGQCRWEWPSGRLGLGRCAPVLACCCWALAEWPYCRLAANVDVPRSLIRVNFGKYGIYRYRTEFFWDLPKPNRIFIHTVFTEITIPYLPYIPYLPNRKNRKNRTNTPSHQGRSDRHSLEQNKNRSDRQLGRSDRQSRKPSGNFNRIELLTGGSKNYETKCSRITLPSYTLYFWPRANLTNLPWPV